MEMLGLVGLAFGIGDRVLLYVGGLFLCVLGYIMARRLPRGSVTETTSSFPQSDYTPPSDDQV